MSHLHSQRSAQRMNSAPVLLRFPHVCELTKLHKNTIYLKINPKSKYYSPDFPKPVKISERCVGFVEQEVLAWIQARMDERPSCKG